MPKLVMLPPLSPTRKAWATRLQQTLPDYEIVVVDNEAAMGAALADADAAYGWVPPALLPQAQKLRWLQNPNVGPHVGYYYPELIEHPVVITNPRGTFNDHIGQHVLMYVLALARGLPYYMAAQQQQRWDGNARQSQYIDLGNATALVAGVGGIGHAAAQYCHAFGMRIIGVDPRWEYELPFIEKHGPDELDQLLPQADFVLVAMPHTPQTEGMWNAARFRLMKPTAYFINVGRGLTTKLDDLAAAIETGQIAGCGLDVYEIEPLPADHKLWTLPNVILTPHIASHQAENIDERQYQILLENARRFAAGEPLQNVVDKAQWY